MHADTIRELPAVRSADSHRAADPLIGTEIDGRFTITHRLGSGGMGAVYAAIQHSINREVAIKVIHAAYSTDKATAMRFLRESWLASRLRSPHIVTVHDFGRTPDGMTYMVMELVEGRTLAAELRRVGALEPVRAVQIAMQICRALEASHQLGVIHRDLKPANIMLDSSGEAEMATVLDFGAAKSVTSQNIGMTEAGIIIGTSRYIAPELIRGNQPAATSDLYSLGAVLYAMLAGRTPFVGDELQVLRGHVLGTPPPLPQTVAPALAGVVSRLLAKSPADRYASAAEVREALAMALSGRCATDDDASKTLELQLADLEIDDAGATSELEPTDYEILYEVPTRGHDIERRPENVVAFLAQTGLRRCRWRVFAVTAAFIALMAALIASGGVIGSGSSHRPRTAGCDAVSSSAPTTQGCR